MIGAVILAAGESRRMGTKKSLLNIRGKRMVELVVDSFKDVVDKLVAVVGHEPDELVQILNLLGVKWAVNRRYKEGMVSSFKRGLEELKECDAVFLALGDQPFVDRDFLLKAIEEWKKGAKVVSPIHCGKKGHPVLFDHELFDEILSLKKDEKIRDLIHRYREQHRLIETGKWAVMDFDSPEDFNRP
jgi:molybdenum cofactor cytidylyltransferase